LADHVDYLIFPVRVTGFVLDNLTFIPTSSMSLLIGMLGQCRFLHNTLFGIMPLSSQPQGGMVFLHHGVTTQKTSGST